MISPTDPFGTAWKAFAKCGQMVDHRSTQEYPVNELKVRKPTFLNWKLNDGYSLPCSSMDTRVRG